MQRTLQELYNLWVDMAMDETNLDTESKKVFNRIRMRFKPGCNEGVLDDMLACGVTAYPWNSQEAQSNAAHAAGDTSVHSLVSQVLEPVFEAIKNKKMPHYPILYTDSRYIDAINAQSLRDKNILVNSTLNFGRLGSPKKEMAAVAAKLKWGEWSVLSKGNVEIIIWADRAVVGFTSSAFPSTLLGSVMRKPPADKNCTWTRMQVPYAIQAYNQRMGGVDEETNHQHRNSSVQHVRILRWPSKVARMLKDRNLTACFLVVRKMAQFMSGVTNKKSMTKSEFIHDYITQAGSNLEFRMKVSVIRQPLITSSPIPRASASGAVVSSFQSPAVNAGAVVPMSAGPAPVSAEMQALPKSRSGQRKRSNPDPVNRIDRHHKLKVHNVIKVAEPCKLSVEEQKKHTLINTHKTGSRDCAVCKAGLGSHAEQAAHTMKLHKVSLRKVTVYACTGCKGRKGHLYMHKECYPFHTAHTGFDRVWE